MSSPAIEQLVLPATGINGFELSMCAASFSFSHAGHRDDNFTRSIGSGNEFRDTGCWIKMVNELLYVCSNKIFLLLDQTIFF